MNPILEDDLLERMCTQTPIHKSVAQLPGGLHMENQNETDLKRDEV